MINEIIALIKILNLIVISIGFVVGVQIGITISEWWHDSKSSDDVIDND